MAWHGYVRALFLHEIDAALTSSSRHTVRAMYSLISVVGAPAHLNRSATPHRWASALLLCRCSAENTTRRDGEAHKAATHRDRSSHHDTRRAGGGLLERVLCVVFMVGCDATLRWCNLAGVQSTSSTDPVAATSSACGTAATAKVTTGSLDMLRSALPQYLPATFAEL